MVPPMLVQVVPGDRHLLRAVKGLPQVTLHWARDWLLNRAVRRKVSQSVAASPRGTCSPCHLLVSWDSKEDPYPVQMR